MEGSMIFSLVMETFCRIPSHYLFLALVLHFQLSVVPPPSLSCLSNGKSIRSKGKTTGKAGSKRMCHTICLHCSFLFKCFIIRRLSSFRLSMPTYSFFIKYIVILFVNCTSTTLKKKRIDVYAKEREYFNTFYCFLHHQLDILKVIYSKLPLRLTLLYTTF